jgi:hypothetical protein
MRVPAHRASIGAAILIVLGILAACSTTGTDRGTTPPSGVTGVGGGNGGGGGGGGGSGSGYSGKYTLVSINDSTPPVVLFYDSVSGPDTTAIFVGTIDSSLIDLNTDLSAVEWDYLTIREARSSTVPGDSNFDRTLEIIDSTGGTYSVSGTTLTLTRIDTSSTRVVSYTIGIHTLSGEVSYSVYNSYGFPVSGTVALVYDLTGSPAHSVVRKRTVSNAVRRPIGLTRARFGTLVNARSALRTRSP